MGFFVLFQMTFKFNSFDEDRCRCYDFLPSPTLKGPQRGCVCGPFAETGFPEQRPSGARVYELPACSAQRGAVLLLRPGLRPPARSVTTSVFGIWVDDPRAHFRVTVCKHTQGI